MGLGGGPPLVKVFCQPHQPLLTLFSWCTTHLRICLIIIFGIGKAPPQRVRVQKEAVKCATQRGLFVNRSFRFKSPSRFVKFQYRSRYRSFSRHVVSAIYRCHALHGWKQFPHRNRFGEGAGVWREQKQPRIFHFLTWKVWSWRMW